MLFGTICWLFKLKLSRSKLYFRFRAERHALNNYYRIVYAVMSFHSLFKPAEVIFSSKSRKESSEKMFPLKVLLSGNDSGSS